VSDWNLWNEALLYGFDRREVQRYVHLLEFIDSTLGN
jgi:hypothetical protein